MPLPNSSIGNQSYNTFDMPKLNEASILPVELNAMYRLLLVRNVNNVIKQS